MTFPLAPGATIGILGGGQLGRMLAIAAARLGYRTLVLERGADCPAAQLASGHVDAAYDDETALEILAAQCDVVTYEFENVPISAARSLAAKLPVLPPPSALEVTQDRLAEKQFLNSAGIPTAPFLAVDSDEELAQGLARFAGSGVVKTRRMGYDGKGQRIFRDSPADAAAGTYVALGSVPLILEGLIPFEREISVIAARGQNGRTTSYDPVENRHRDGILRRSTVPAAISKETAEAARAAAHRIADALDYVGVLAVEFFVLEGGAVLANEIAPRVHNSGHWTEAACAVSQFEQHIRAIAGLPLGDPARHSDAVMENLIGHEVWRAPALLEEPSLVLNLYGKAKTRPGRKMGHVTRLLRRRD